VSAIVPYSESPAFNATFTYPLPDLTGMPTSISNSDAGPDLASRSSTNPNVYHEFVSNPSSSSSASPLDSYLPITEPIRIALLRHDANAAPALLAAAVTEWRFVLAHGAVDIQVKLHSPLVPDLLMGVLHLQLSVSPLPAYPADGSTSGSPPVYLSPQEISRYVSRDATAAQTHLHRCYREWLAWDHALASASDSHPDLHTRRGLPLFISDEHGCRRPVTSLVAPLYMPGCSTATPEMAARFVAGIPVCERPDQVR
jgi:hypothetical protein